MATDPNTTVQTSSAGTKPIASLTTIYTTKLAHDMVIQKKEHENLHQRF